MAAFNLGRVYISYVVVVTIILLITLFVGNRPLTYGPFPASSKLGPTDVLEGAYWLNGEEHASDFELVDCLPHTIERIVTVPEHPQPIESGSALMNQYDYLRDLEAFRKGPQAQLYCDGHPENSRYIYLAFAAAILPFIAAMLTEWSRKKANNAQTH